MTIITGFTNTPIPPMGTIYSNGCSWTSTNGIEQDPTLSYTQGWPIDDVIKVTNNLTWTAKLAQKLNYSYANDSLSGGSNARMVRKTVDFIKNWPKEKRDELLVVLGWTSLERREFFLEYNGVEEWCYLNPSQKFSEQWKFRECLFPKYILSKMDEYQEIHTKYFQSPESNFQIFMQDISLLSSLFENLGIKYLFFSSLGHITTPDLIQLYPKSIKFLENPKFMNIAHDSMWSFVHNNNIPVASCLHPMVEAHSRWADELYKHYITIYGNQNDQTAENC